ncbi:MAG: fumarate hydratase [Candidatus Omnitrophica bacterium]|nr:fumarate hydratase [Candidatus Omnitrophota bacterium]
MRTVENILITKTAKDLCLKANLKLREDILSALKAAREKERSLKSRHMLDAIIENAAIAKKKKLPICQDTGMVVAYLKVGQEVKVRGDIKKAVEKGIGQAYKEGYLRKSIVSGPLVRKNTGTNLPAIIYTDLAPGSRIDIRIAIKGFGCENASKTRMFKPMDTARAIEDFVVASVKEAGSRPCPPVYVGVGIGGTLDKAVSLSKQAIFRKVNGRSKVQHIASLEKGILKRINNLKIGVMGMGGKVTALGVSILTYPTHIAGLPVAVNISCHATRDARKVI